MIYTSGFFLRFMTSDDAEILSRIMSENKATRSMMSANETIGNIEETLDGYPRTIIDIELLSRCDQLVFTGGSTYGFVAALKSQQAAYYVNGRSTMSECKLHELGKPSVTDKGGAVF